MGHLAKDGVAGDVPKGVVYLFETIEVDEHHRHLALAAGQERLSQPFGEHGPVRQARQCVVVGLVLTYRYFPAELLEQLAAAQGDPGVGRQGLEEP